jgi:hypothetical protein
MKDNERFFLLGGQRSTSEAFNYDYGCGTVVGTNTKTGSSSLNHRLSGLEITWNFGEPLVNPLMYNSAVLLVHVSKSLGRLI